GEPHGTSREHVATAHRSSTESPGERRRGEPDQRPAAAKRILGVCDDAERALGDAGEPWIQRRRANGRVAQRHRIDGVLRIFERKVRTRGQFPRAAEPQQFAQRRLEAAVTRIRVVLVVLMVQACWALTGCHRAAPTGRVYDTPEHAAEALISTVTKGTVD